MTVLNIMLGILYYNLVPLPRPFKYVSMFLPLILTLLIVIVAVSGDKLLDYYKNPLVRALVDNVAHGTIGLLTWSVVLSFFPERRKYIIYSKAIDILLCGFIASAIDVDHFLHFKKAEDRRGFLHCTTLWIAVCVSCFTISKVRNLVYIS